MKKKRVYKHKQTHRKVRYNSNEPYKLINTGIKAATGVAVLGITATTLTNLKP